jgi:carboxyl-terminal processing protease
MFRDDVFFPQEQGVGGFTRSFLGTKPAITHNFDVDDKVLKEFRDYLAKHNIRYTEPEFTENQDWIKRKIKQEVFMSSYGTQEGFKVLLEADPQVQKAVDAIPQARALYENARKVVAQRSGSNVHFNQP